MIEKKLQRCDEFDPNRCKSISSKSGQCPYLAAPGSQYCQRHGANKAIQAEQKRSRNMYRLQIWQERLEEFTTSSECNTLKNEVGILRLALEEILNKCTDSNHLLLYSQKISDLAVKIEKLISSSHRIEKSLGTLLDKSAALSFAGEVINIISQFIDDPEVIDSVSNGIINALVEHTG